MGRNRVAKRLSVDGAAWPAVACAPRRQLGPAEVCGGMVSIKAQQAPVKPTPQSPTTAPVGGADAAVDGDDDADERHRARTMSRKQMAREHRKMRARGEVAEVVSYWRPQNRSECLDMDRPCLYVSCRHHLYLDVNPETGSVKLNFPDKEPWELQETCALDVADRGGITLEDVGTIMNLTRERIRQVEVRGLQKLKEVPDGNNNLDVYIDWDPYNPRADF
jgi:hypothetical protein